MNFFNPGNWFEEQIAGMFENLWTSITQPLRDSIINAIISMLGFIFDTIGIGTSGISSLLTEHPEQFDRIELFGENVLFQINGMSVYSFMQGISNAVILPFALMILVVLSIHELVTGIINSNIREFDPTLMMKWGIKFVVSIFILSNVFTIVDVLFRIGPALSDLLFSSGLNISDISVDLGDTATITDSLQEMPWMQLIGLITTTAGIAVFTLVLQIIILQTLLFRMLEIALVLSLAPIPLATFSNSEHKRAGENFIRTLIVYGLQAFLILVVIFIFTGMLSTMLTTTITSGNFSLISFIPVIIIMIGMTGFIRNSKSLAERVVS